MTIINKSARLSRPERERLSKKVATQYEKGKSIREIGEATGRSYGAVHRMLTDAGVSFRTRGGAVRKKR